MYTNRYLALTANLRLFSTQNVQSCFSLIKYSRFVCFCVCVFCTLCLIQTLCLAYMKDEFTDLFSTLLPRLGETKNRTNFGLDFWYENSQQNVMEKFC